uniref:Uncharacterized protein n=1 Tax=Oryza nivara TaxID=4536 RepID=A0A0E0G137_ORYNI
MIPQILISCLENREIIRCSDRVKIGTKRPLQKEEPQPPRYVLQRGVVIQLLLNERNPLRILLENSGTSIEANLGMGMV